MYKKPKILVILGPTASGKSALAVTLARRFNGEIISADSRQVYRGLDIGSGKITQRGRRGVRHHLLDVASPRRTFTAAQYQRRARLAVRDILRRGKLPIICGGTGFYIDALISGTRFPAVQPNPMLRNKLERKTAAELFKRLRAKDPRRARTIDRYNKPRLIRALEIIEATGRRVPPLRRPVNSPFSILMIGLRLPQEKLSRNIHRRLLARMRQGMVAEVRRLRARGITSRRLEALGLEYRYVNRYIENKIDKPTMLASLEQEINNYVKRQMNWFKREQNIVWITKPIQATRQVRSFLKI